MPLFLFIFHIFTHTYIHSITAYNTIIRRYLLGPLSISSSLAKLSGKNLPVMPIKLGPAVQHADVLPTEPRRSTPHFSHVKRRTFGTGTAHRFVCFQ